MTFKNNFFFKITKIFLIFCIVLFTLYIVMNYEQLMFQLFMDLKLVKIFLIEYFSGDTMRNFDLSFAANSRNPVPTTPTAPTNTNNTNGG